MKSCAFLLGFLACIGGCSAKEANSDPYATVSEFCAAWGKTACSSKVVHACSGKTTTSELTEMCVQTQQAFCEGLVPVAGYNSTNAQKCLDAVGSDYAHASLSASDIATVRHLGEPCNHLIKGPQAEGDSCTQDNDCDTLKNLQCVMKSGVGTCVVPTPVAPGLSCKAAEDECMDGFYCDGSHCVSQGEVTDKCSADCECGNGLTCDGASDAGTQTGTCATRMDPGTCAADTDCPSNVCDIATGSTSGICVDSITLGPTEGICGALR